MANLILRNNDRICDNVIDERCAHCSAIAEITDLHWGGPVGKNSGTRPARLTVEINYDVDFHFTHHGRDLGITQSLHVDEAVERSLDPPAHCASVVGAQRNRSRVETRSIVMLEHTSD